MTTKFKTVLLRDGTGGIQTADHYFDFGGDMKALAAETNRLLHGGDLKASSDQPKASFDLHTHGNPNREWYSPYTLGLMAKHVPKRRNELMEECHFPHERVFLHEFFLLNPPNIISRDHSKSNQPPWIAAIDEERIKQGLSRSDLVAPFGVNTVGAVNHYMTGRRPISIEQLIDVCAFLALNPAPIIEDLYNKAFRKKSS